MQYIINSSNQVAAVHDEGQNVIDLYPGCKSFISAGRHELGETLEIPTDYYEDFNAASGAFRTVCARIGEAIGNPEFKGGFDEMAEFQQSGAYATVAGLQLAMAWSAANELCKYEGAKIGLGQPGWWYKCWEEREL